MIAEESDFNEIIRPLVANQILARSNEKYEIEFIKNLPDFGEKLHNTATSLVVRPKGIFAADESGGNIHKKFEAIGLEDSRENRRRYREMFFTTPDIQNYLSGVILFEETVSQSNSDGQNFVDYLKDRGMLVGVKLDGGLAPLAGFEGEMITKGLDFLDEKLKKYAEKSVDFAKWRVAFDIDAERENMAEDEKIYQQMLRLRQMFRPSLGTQKLVKDMESCRCRARSYFCRQTQRRRLQLCHKTNPTCFV